MSFITELFQHVNELQPTMFQHSCQNCVWNCTFKLWLKNLHETVFDQVGSTKLGLHQNVTQLFICKFIEVGFNITYRTGFQDDLWSCNRNCEWMYSHLQNCGDAEGEQLWHLCRGHRCHNVWERVNAVINMRQHSQQQLLKNLLGAEMMAHSNICHCCCNVSQQVVDLWHSHCHK